jgi:hypothetical protein
MLWMGIWVYPYTVSWFRLQNPLTASPNHGIVCKVFEHLEMLWMGIWVHPYALNTLCRLG